VNGWTRARVLTFARPRPVGPTLKGENMQSVELRRAFEELVAHLDNRPRCDRTEYRPFYDEGFVAVKTRDGRIGTACVGEAFSPVGKTSCTRIDGPGAVAHGRALVEAARKAIKSAEAAGLPEYIEDALAGTLAFLSAKPDMTVNCVNIPHERDPATGELRPCVEYVRADALDAFKGVLSRIPAADPEDAEYRPRKSDDAYCVIQFLHQQRAFDKSSLCRTEDIAAGMTGRSNDQNSYKHAVAKLSDKGIVQTATGRRGGVWLTDKGELLAAGIFSTETVR